MVSIALEEGEGFDSQNGHYQVLSLLRRLRLLTVQRDPPVFEQNPFKFADFA